MNIEDFSLFINNNLNKEKIVLGPIDDNTHATIQIGNKSKILDIHLTTETFPKEYKTLLQIQHSTLTNIFHTIQKDLIKIGLKYYSTYINLGKLKRFNAYVMPLSIQEISKYITLNQTKKTIRFKKLINNNEFDKVLFNINDTVLNIDRYALFGIRRSTLVFKGMIFKSNANSNRVIFLSKIKMKKLSHELLNLVLQNIKDIDINEFNSLSNFMNRGFS